jgi:GT2 family glycosyltransferase
MRDAVDVLIPTYRRPASLAVTLSGLVAQTHEPLRVVVSDQTDDEPVERSPLVESVVRILRANGTEVELCRNVPRRGLAQQRQFLLDKARAPYALFLDDDVVIEANLVERLVAAIKRAGCGFVGSALVGLSYVGDTRPHEEHIEFVDAPVEPEKVEPGGSGWERHRLHNAANLEHLKRRLEPTGDRLYRVAWVGGCVLYDVAMLREVGGFEFWRELPEAHAGEDVVAQLRVMERFGGVGLFPSGAYHLELPTTVPDRTNDAPLILTNQPQAEQPTADEEPVAVES